MFPGVNLLASMFPAVNLLAGMFPAVNLLASMFPGGHVSYYAGMVSGWNNPEDTVMP